MDITSFDVDSEKQRQTTFRSSRLWTWMRTGFAILIPSFINQPKPTTIHPTTYLDGFRGLFSFLVFVRHYLLPWEAGLDTGYRQRDQEAYARSFVKLPIIRLLYSGPTVAIFFVVSGFVLSCKPLRLIRDGSHEKIFHHFASSIFRRALRLFIPPMITTLFVAFAVHFRLYRSPYEDMPGTTPRHPKVLGSMVFQLSDWTRFVFEDLTHPWTWKSPRSEYDSHLWTIPIQFRASMIVFLTLLGLAKTRVIVRSAILLALWVYSLQQGRWDVALFFAGILLSEINLESRNWSSLRARLFSKVVFVSGLYIGSFPRLHGAGRATPGFVWMATLNQQPRFWQSLAATLLVGAMSKDALLQGIFNWSPLRYLGKISFSLYLVHGPLLHLFGYWFVSAFLGWTGKSSTSQYQSGVLLALVFLTPIVLWVADVFWQLVDRPCGNWVRRVESWCFRE